MSLIPPILRPRWTWWRLLLLLWLVGCMKPAPPPPPMEAGGYGGMYADSAEMEMATVASSAPRGRAMAKSASPMAAPPPPPPPPPPPMADGSSPQLAQEPQAVATPSPARMVHYSGWARLRVDKVETATDTLSALAKASGGWVERMGGNSITLRVPVGDFRAKMAEILKMGEVLDKNISAQDVTEAFLSVELRLQTARGARDRLVALLAKSEDENEKLALVREIQRLSEEIDRLESQGKTLGALANFSRITVELVPREALAWQGAGAESLTFAWIRALSPFNDDIVGTGKRLKLPVPDGMVELDLKRRFIAESPDGARIWSGKLQSLTLGDSAFWVSALQERFGKEFASAEVRTYGQLKVLRLVDRGDNPYTWLIGVRAEGKTLHLVEVLFPDAAAEARYGAAVEVSLRSLGGDES